MTASIGDLLAGAERLAWKVVSRPASPEATAGLLAAWPVLARTALRAMDAVPLPPGERLRSVRSGLASVEATGTRASEAVVVPDPAVAGVAQRLGAIADLLVDEPQAVSMADLESARALRSSLLVPVYAITRATLAGLEQAAGPVEPQWAFQALSACTEPFALVPAGARSSRYDQLAAIPAGERSLEAAIAAWSAVTLDSLAGRYTVTGTALQTAAGDALILTAAAAVVVRAAGGLGVVEPAMASDAEQALRHAHLAWGSSARWPAGVRVDGARPVDQLLASRRLRHELDALRDGPGWRDPAAMEASFGVERLLAATGRGVHATANVALSHFQAIDNLVRGRERLWIAVPTITEPEVRAWAALQAGGHNRWVLLPQAASIGRAMIAAAAALVPATSRAVAALDATRHPSPVVTDPAMTLSLVEGRLSAAPPERVEHVVSPGAARERRRPLTSPGPTWTPRP